MASQQNSPQTALESPYKNHGPQLFQLLYIQNERIQLDGVYINGLHALKKLYIQNLSDHQLRIGLKSTLGEQMAFQMTNENFPQISDDSELRDLTLNTSHACAFFKTSTEHSVHHFNQTFNFVNHVQEFILQPKQMMNFILAFLPDSKLRKSPSWSVDSLDATSKEEVDEEYFEMIKIEGFIILTANIITDSEKEKKEISIEETEECDQQAVYKFKAKCCKSVLWSDVTDHGIQFDDCALNGIYFKDFTVWNRSEIDLYWTFHYTRPSPDFLLQLTDYDTAEPLDCKTIPGFGYKRIRVCFLPKSVGEFETELIIENLNDSELLTLTLTATVYEFLQKETLLVTTGNTLEFGDCYSGMIAKQTLNLKNISDQTQTVQFSSDYSKCTFIIKTDEEEEYFNESFHSLSSHRIDSTTNDSIPNSILSSRASSPTFLSRQDSDGRSSVFDFFDDYQIQKKSEEPVHSSSHVKNLDEIEITEIQLKPQSEKKIHVFFIPEPEQNYSLSASKLNKFQFKIFLFYYSMNQQILNTSSGTQLSKQKKVIYCKSRVCTSFITVSPKELNFGDVNVGTLKSLPLTIQNLSELPTQIELKFQSKILNALHGPIQIPPKQTVEIKIDIYPRKVNPQYRKQICVLNLHGKEELTVDVLSNNMDQNRVTFHSLFYKIWTEMNTNYIDYGVTILNNSAYRTFTLENISQNTLQLEMTSSLPDEIQIYMIRQGEPISPLPRDQNDLAVERKEKLLEAMEDRLNKTIDINSIGSASTSTSPTATTAIEAAMVETSEPAPSVSEKQKEDESKKESIDEKNADYLDLASPSIAQWKMSPRKSQSRKVQVQRKVTNNMQSLLSEKDLQAFVSESSSTENIQSKEEAVTLPEQPSAESITKPKAEPLDERIQLQNLILAYENHSKHPKIFPKPNLEGKFIKQQIAMKKELNQAMKERRLIPFSTIELAAHSKQLIIVEFTPSAKNRPYVHGRPKKLDAKIFIKLLKFDWTLLKEADASLQPLMNEQVSNMPVRELLLRTFLCRGLMEIGQKNINFGLVQKKEKRIKTIVIYNRSDALLEYSIRKSGSVSSGDIFFGEGRSGIIRAYGKREVDFLFMPSLPGNFVEKLVIENLQDPENDQYVTLKAVIRKPSNFFIQSLDISFGPCLLDQPAQKVPSVLIMNTSQQKRMIEISYDPKTFLSPQAQFQFDFEIPPANPDSKHERMLQRRLMMSKEELEELDHLEQKLKIAKRKGRKEKIKKIKEKLTQLTGIEDDDIEGSTGELEKETSRPVSAGAFSSGVKKTENSILFPLEPKQTQLVLVKLTPKSNQPLMEPITELKMEGILNVCEYKNTDAYKSVACRAVLYFQQSDYETALQDWKVAQLEKSDLQSTDGKLDYSMKGHRF